MLAERPIGIVITTSELEYQRRNDPRLFGSIGRIACEGTLAFAELIATHRDETPPLIHYEPSDTAMLVYTSGTTGLPKGAMNSHGNVVFTAQVYRDWIELREGDGILGIAPLFHITGLIGHIATCFSIAGALTLAYRFEAGVMLDAFRERQPAFTIGAITALMALMNHPDAKADSLTSLRSIYSGGAPIAPAVVAQFEAKFGLYIRNAYGMTESTSPATVSPLDKLAPVDPLFGALSVGVPTFNTDIRIVDAETAQPLPHGEAGEIIIKGPQVVSGYWRKPEATLDAIRDGWLHTGDIGVIDKDGWLFLGRSQERHDQRRRLQGLAARSRGRAVYASSGTRSRSGRRAGCLSRRNGESGAQPEGRHYRDAGRNHRPLPRADGGLQGTARGRLPAGAAEDRHRQDPAPGTARLGPGTKSARTRRALCSAEQLQFKRVMRLRGPGATGLLAVK